MIITFTTGTGAYHVAASAIDMVILYADAGCVVVNGEKFEVTNPGEAARILAEWRGFDRGADGERAFTVGDFARAREVLAGRTDNEDLSRRRPDGQ